MGARHRIWMGLAATGLALLAAACGPDGSQEVTGTMAAALHVPRALIDDLASVEVYVYRQKDGEPEIPVLLAEEPPAGSHVYDNYKDYSAYKHVTIHFQDTDTADIKGIPDRGPVWIFYARGLDNTPWLIGHGAAGPVSIDSGQDYTEVSIDLIPIP